ncbi:MAG: SET domain-containing protein [Anaerolineae bacterium]|nr:SET domain-containing protein [Anaerolineae bacterium]MDW8173393.1 SET domain-containing protein [Anaerolineae bacterium]
MLHPHIRVREDGVIEGRGLVAVDLIREGEVVSRLEPNQPRYSLAAALRLSQEERDALLHDYYQCSADELVGETGDERFMNHSCDPNTWWADDDTMVARRDILPGEEVTYDYATTDVDLPFAMICRCGSSNCRGVVTYLDHLLPSWQARFGDHLPAHTKAAIARTRQAWQQTEG